MYLNEEVDGVAVSENGNPGLESNSVRPVIYKLCQ
jgi:hypothetical protein